MRIDKLKVPFRDIVKQSMPAAKEKARGAIARIAGRVKRKSHAFRNKAVKVEKEKERITNSIKKEIKSKMDDYTEKELKFIVKYIKLCRSMDERRPKIRKELLKRFKKFT